MDYTYFNNSNTDSEQGGLFKKFNTDGYANIKDAWGMGKFGGAVKNLFTGASPEGVYVGIGGIIFDIIGDYSVNMNNKITNNLTERQSGKTTKVSTDTGTKTSRYYNDNVACQPLEITIDALVGECFVDRANETGNDFQTYWKVVKTINSIVPAFSNKVAKVKQTVTNVLNTADFAVQLASNINNALQGISKQRQAFQYVESLRQCQYPVTVTLPTLGNFPNMMVKSVRWSQPKDSEYYSKVNFVFQEWRQTDVNIGTFKVSNSNHTVGGKKYGRCGG